MSQEPVSESSFDHLLHTSLVGVFWINKEGHIIKINKRCQDAFKLSKLDESKDLLLWEIGWDQQGKRNLRTFVKQGGGAKKFHLAFNKNSDHHIDLELIASEKNGEPYYLGICQDVSKGDHLKKELKREKELKNRINEKLEKEKELGEMKTRFVSMASHEFKTPLAGVLSSLQLIKRYLEAEETNWEGFIHKTKIERHFQKIEDAVTNLTYILNDFLSLGKLERNKIDVKHKPFNIKVFLEDTARELGLLCKDGQEIVCEHKGQEEVTLDAHILRNIMNNLVYNSIKYSKEGSSIHLISQADKNKLSIEVKDHGMGIPETEKKNIFRRFFRADNATNFQGTGIGLSIVRRYTELLKGKIDFESEENKGTSFFLTFPKQTT